MAKGTFAKMWRLTLCGWFSHICNDVGRSPLCDNQHVIYLKKHKINLLRLCKFPTFWMARLHIFMYFIEYILHNIIKFYHITFSRLQRRFSNIEYLINSLLFGQCLKSNYLFHGLNGSIQMVLTSLVH